MSELGLLRQWEVSESVTISFDNLYQCKAAHHKTVLLQCFSQHALLEKSKLQKNNASLYFILEQHQIISRESP